MDLVKIGKYIAGKRKALGMTQKQLAEKLNMSDKSVSKWERGICLPDVSVYMELCEILGISINEFLAGEDIDAENVEKKSEDNIIQVTKDSKKKQKNLKIIDENSTKTKMLKKIRPSLAARYKAGIQKKCDAQVYIGGSIFMEYPTWKNIVSWWQYQSSQYPFFVLGANFGPYHTEEYRSAMDKVYTKLKDICFRDSYSKNLFADNDHVRQAPDILFSYPMPKMEENKKQIFISVISYKDKELNSDFDQMTNEEYIEKMVQITSGFSKEGYQVILASFCREEGDLDAVQEIKNRSEQQKNITIIDYDGTNRNQLLEEMSRSIYIIAARFHGTILGLAAGKSVFPILYSDKTKYVLEDLGFHGEYADLRDPDSLSFENAKKNLESGYKIDVTESIQNAEKHFEKLDEFLNN